MRESLRAQYLAKFRLIVPILFVLSIPLLANGAGRTWDGGGTADGFGNYLWSDALNWDGNLTAPVANDSIIFQGSLGTPQSNDLTADITLAGLTYNAGTASFSISGNRITLGGNITDSATAAQTLNLAMILNGDRTISVGTGGSLSIGGLISQDATNRALTKSGAGTLTLGANNTYLGNTILDGGTLAYSATQTGVKLLQFGATNTSANNSALDLTAASVTATGITAQTKTANNNTITLGSGQTLTVSGNVLVGGLTATATTDNPITNLVVSGASATVNLGSGSGGSLVVSNRKNANTGSGDTINAKLDLSSLGTFTANYGPTGFISVGAGTTGTGDNAPFGQLILGTNNTLTAGTLNVGINNGGGNTSKSSVSLGQTNLIKVDNINIGAGKSQGTTPVTGTVSFRSLVNPTATFIGSNGTSRVNLLSVGAGNLNANGSGTGMGGTLDLTGGSVSALVDTLKVGVQAASGTGASAGNLLFSAGTFDVNTLTIGIQGTTATSAAATGTLTISGTGSLQVNTAFTLASKPNAGSGAITGNLAINGGTVTTAADITDGGGTSKITLAGGTLNLANHNIGSSSSPIDNLDFQSGTLQNVAEINGGGATWHKTTTGTLTLGTNNYTGDTQVDAGTVLVSGTLNAASTMTLNTTAATSLAGTGTAGGVTLQSDNGAIIASIRPGATAADGSVGILNMQNLTVNGGSIRLDVPNPDTGSHDKVVVNNAASFNSASKINLVTLPGLGFYTLLTAGNLSGTSPSLVLPSGGGGTTRTTYDLAFGTTVANAITLNVTGAPAKTLTWTGLTNTSGSFLWDVNTTSNWNDSGNFAVNNENYFDGDSVIFGNGPTNRNVTLNAIVLPGSLTVDNDNSNPYSISGSGQINGTIGLTKKGVGALTLSTTNSYSGTTAVQNGTLILGSSGALPTGANVALGDGAGNSGVLDLNGNSVSVSSLAVTAGAGGANIITNNSTSTDATLTISATTNTFSGSIQDGTVLGAKKTLLNLPTGTLILTGNNSYSGNTTIASGTTLQLGSGGNSGALSGATVISNSGTLIFNRSDALAVPGVIQGSGPVRQQGAGTTTLSGANTYNGPTTIAAGTLAVGASGTLGDGTSALTIGNSTSTGALDLTANSATVASLTVSPNSATANTITVGSSKTFTVNGNVLVGGLSAASQTTVLNVTGGGTLALANSGGTLIIGNQAAANATTSSATVDLSGLSNFTANYGASGKIGIGAGATFVAGNANSGTLILGGSNTLTAQVLKVHFNGTNAGAASSLRLGQSNIINADTITIAAGKGTGNLNFRSGLTNPTLQVRAADSTSAVANFNVGDYSDYSSGGASTNNTGIVDLTTAGGSDGSIDALVTNLNIGIGRIQGGGTAQASGTLTFDKGTINATNIVVGARGTTSDGTTGNPSAGATGTLNIQGTGSLVAGSGGIVLGKTNSGVGTGTGTLNVTGGTVTTASDISDGGDASTVTLNGGTIDMQTHSFSNIDNLNLQSGTLKNLGGISGTVSDLVKTTAGTLILDGSNTYSGQTLVNAGTLTLAATGTIANTPTINVAASANFDVSAISGGFSLASKTLTGTGAVLGKIKLDAGGSIKPGASATDGSVGTLSIANLTGNGGDIRVDLTNPDPGTHDSITVSGTADFSSANVTTVTLATVPAQGTYTVISAGTLIGTNISIVPLAGARPSTLTPDFSTPNTFKIIVPNGPASLTWDNTNASVGGGSGNGTDWDVQTNQNWNSTAATGNPYKYYQGDAVTFNDSNNSTNNANAYNVNITTTVNPGSVLVDNSAGNYIFSGGGGISGATGLTKQGSSMLTINTVNTYTGPTLVSAGSLVLNGSLSGSAVTVAGAATFSESASGSIGGSVNLTSSGTTVLAGTNSYSGVTTISGGTLSATSLNDIGTNSSIGTGNNTSGATNAASLVLSGGTLQWTSSSSQTTNRGFTLTQNSGTIDSSPTSSGAALTISGPIAYSGSGARTLTLTGTDTSPGVNTLSSVIADGTGGATSVTKSGNTLWLLGAANTFSGDVNVTGGTLRLGNVAALGTTVGVTNINGGTVDLNGLALGNTEQFNVQGTGVGGNGALINNGAGSAANNISRFTLTGDATIGGSGRWDFRGNNPVVDLGGFTLTKTGANQISVVAGTINPGGHIIVNQGLFSIETTSVVTGSGDITFNSGSTFQLFGSAANTLNMTRQLNINGTVTVSNNSNQPVTVASPVTLNGTMNFQSSNTGTVTFSGNIGELSAGAGLITKNAANTVVLSGTNTYSGGTTVGNGTLQLGTTTALGSSTGALTVNGGTVDLHSNSISVGALSGPGGTITSTTGGATTLTIGNGNGGGTFAGIIGNGSATVALVKTGGGTETLSGNNTYSGGTLVSAGTLIVGQVNALGSGGLNVNTNGTAILQADLSAPVQLPSLTIAGGMSLPAGDFGSSGVADTTALSSAGGSPPVVAAVQPVPEPSTLVLAAIGVAGIGIARRRRR